MAQRLRFKISDFGSYVSHSDYMLVKLHGSVGWGQEVEGFSFPGNWGYEQLIEKAGTLTISNRFRLVSEVPMSTEEGCPVFPALAIPLEKKDEFACPQEHVQALAKVLPSVTKIMTVGWRASEDKFLSMLQNKLTGLTGRPELMVVSGDNQGALATLDNLRKARVPFSEGTSVTDGFTGLIRNLGLFERFVRYS